MMYDSPGARIGARTNLPPMGDANVYLVPGGIGHAHSDCGNGDGGGCLDQAASVSCLFILPQKLIIRICV